MSGTLDAIMEWYATLRPAARDKIALADLHRLSKALTPDTIARLTAATAGEDVERVWRFVSLMWPNLPLHLRRNNQDEKHEIDRILAAIAARHPTDDLRRTREAAWREGWSDCKACLTDDEAFCLTVDVEEDTWRDSKTCALSTVSKARGA